MASGTKTAAEMMRETGPGSAASAWPALTEVVEWLERRISKGHRQEGDCWCSCPKLEDYCGPGDHVPIEKRKCDCDYYQDVRLRDNLAEKLMGG